MKTLFKKLWKKLIYNNKRLLPSELYPTKVRTIGHSLSSSLGKLGALVAAISFDYIDYIPSLYYISGICGLIGLVLTYIFVPDVTTLPLVEND